ncbi:MAG: NAD-dependent epimerase/dehydratase family protein [Thermoprotei archaeon]
MKVFVTGAGGFVGINVVEELINNGYDVIGLVRSKNEDILKHMGIKVVKGDLLQPESFMESLRNVDAVIHLASPHPYKYSVEYRRKNHIDATKNLLEVMIKNNVKRIIFSSVSEVMGNSNKLPFTEDMEERPIMLHAKFKLETERLIESYERLDYTILRIVTIYGPWQINDGFYILIKGIANGEYWTKFYIGNGEKLTQLVYVKDVAKAFRLALEKEVSLNRKYFIAEERPYTYKELYTTICKKLGRKPPTHGVPVTLAKLGVKFLNLTNKITKGNSSFFNSEVIEIMSKDRYYSVEKAKKELGFKATPLSEGLEKTILWYKERNLI